MANLCSGGSILADFLANHSAPVGREHIYAAVRSNEQAEVLSKLGVSVLQVDLTDEKSVVENILRYQSTQLTSTIAEDDFGSEEITEAECLYS